MNTNHVSRMMLAATDPAEAFGKPGVLVHIATHACHIRRDGCEWHVQDDREAVHSFSGAKYGYEDVLESMASYFEIVDMGK